MGVPFWMLVPSAVGRRCGSLLTSLVEVHSEWPADSHMEESGYRVFAIGARTADAMSLCSWDMFVSAGHATLYKGSRVLIPLLPTQGQHIQFKKGLF